MENVKVLVVEDESSIRKFININLERSGFEVIEAESGEEGLKKLVECSPEVVVLDIMLPGIDGFEVCRRIREEKSDAVVIMLTAKGQDMDKIVGLELGADDYMAKPFNPLELVARIRANLRRISKPSRDNKNIVASGSIRLDITAQKFCKNGIDIELTPREFAIVKVFMESQGKAFSRDELLNHIWGRNYFGDIKTVDVHIRRLREKIEDDPSEPKLIETVWGFGYRWRKAE